MNNGLKKALVLVFICSLLIGGVWYTGLHNYLTLASLHDNKVYLEETVAAHYYSSIFIYCIIYIVIISLALPGVPILTMLGGFLFGCIPAIAYASIAATVGATVSFLVIRYMLSAVIRGKYAQKLETFNEKISAQGVASYLLTLQLMGLIPYFVINSLAALADVPLYTFVWTTFVGSLPIISIYSFAGKQLYKIESLQDIFSVPVIVVFVLFIVVALLPVFIRFSRRSVDL